MTITFCVFFVTRFFQVHPFHKFVDDGFGVDSAFIELLLLSPFLFLQ